MKKNINAENLTVIESVKSIIAKKGDSKKEAALLLNKWRKKIPKKNSTPILSENCN